jgi:hypothetical protein
MEQSVSKRRYRKFGSWGITKENTTFTTRRKFAIKNHAILLPQIRNDIEIMFVLLNSEVHD